MSDSAAALVPVAQYIRMSTEHQRYSADNQASAIEMYAATHGYEVVKTYADLGKSGLTLKGRAALKQLLSDVESRDAAFEAVLVYDVSRRGRFLDPDEAAACEATCKRAGVAVHYCAEPFCNDGSAVSSILKSLKRVMAAEYSRDLSEKIYAAQRRMASFGFVPTRWRPLGVRRVAIDHRGRPVQVLEVGERSLRGCRVTFMPGSPEETALVRRVFRLFGERGWKQTRIARTLNKEGSRNPNGGVVWTNNSVRHLLKNEIYIGNYVFGKTTTRLTSAERRVPQEDWVRAEGVIAPIVSRALFNKVQKRLANNAPPTNAKLLDDLRDLIARHGRVSSLILRDQPGVSSSDVYIKRFGSMAEAYRRVGYDPFSRRQMTHLVQATQMLRNALAAEVAAIFRTAGHAVEFSRVEACLRIDDAFEIDIRCRRRLHLQQRRRAWTYQARHPVTAALTLIERLDDELKTLDYCLMTPVAFGGDGGFIYLAELPRPRAGLETFSSLDCLYDRCMSLLGRDVLHAPLAREPDVGASGSEALA